MRQATRKSLVSFAAAGGMLALVGGTAHAGSSAEGGAQGSPGVLSGNNVQAPVHVPVNACGNTVSVIGVLNPAMGNKCANVSTPAQHHEDGHHDGGHQGGHHDGGHQDGHDGGGASAEGSAVGSPGVGSGNNVQAPVHVPVNVCGNSATVIGGLNPAMGNECANVSQEVPENPAPEQPEQPEEPEGETPQSETPRGPSVPKERITEVQAERTAQGELAETGASVLGTAAPVGAALLLGGYVLYRRARTAQR